MTLELLSLLCTSKNSLKDQQLLPSFAFVFVNFAWSVILEAVQNKLLTLRKVWWSLYSPFKIYKHFFRLGFLFRIAERPIVGKS